MSLVSIVEVAIQVENFKNIDLYNQGFYRCDFKLYHLEGENKIYANPTNIKVSEITKKRRRAWENKKEPDVLDAKDGEINQSAHTSSTRTFVIRYCDEEVEINDILIFRIEIPVDADYLEKEIH